MLRQLIKAALAALVVVAIAAPALADGPVYKTWRGIAIKGYDPVAYHTERRPVKGSEAFEYEWNGATWRFASAEHRDLFAAEPERYAPAYGGYCAYGVAQGYKPKIDPEAWTIVDDRLYLNLSKQIQNKWEQDIPGYIAQADAIWPTIRDD